jgi:hypothetical protein
VHAVEELKGKIVEWADTLNPDLFGGGFFPLTLELFND